MTTKKQNKEKKNRHKDCAWLVPSRDGYRCCDVRTPYHENGMGEEELQKEACPYFHKKNKV